MSMGYAYPKTFKNVLFLKGFVRIGVDFCVTRFDYMGNAKALNRGMGNWYRFPRFLFINS